MPNINLAWDEQSAWDKIEDLTTCSSCIHFTDPNLFGGTCSRLGGMVGIDERCEEFFSRSKQEGYWIDKLVEMAQEFSGKNDFFRQLDFHERMGTADKFLQQDKIKL